MAPPSQASEDRDEAASVTRWSFEDFERAYEKGFTAGGINGCHDVGNRRTHNDASDGQEFGGAVVIEKHAENGDAKKGAGRDSDNQKVTSYTAVYEQYLKNGAGVEEGPDAKLTDKTNEKWPPKSLPVFASQEMRDLAESITRDIVRDTADVGWHTIKGLENAKRLLKEAVVMPIKYPQYFTGLLTPWKGILLYGPSGTGKTMLAKAVASECNTTFFNISASSIVSKWRGDSEKLVRVLFELARHHAPSTIFLDEIDSIISQRGEGRSEHEASRRLKTELLVQMDGLAQSNDLVFLLAATNLPWDLDAAMLRRLEKRILVPLPEPEARQAMFQSLLSRREGTELPYDLMVELTEGYSGSDVRIVCKEAAMRPLRRLVAELEEIEQRHEPPDAEKERPTLGAITEEDVRMALKTTRPSAHLMSSRYDQFDADFGSQSIS